VHGFLKHQIANDDASLHPVIHWRHFPEQGHSEVTVVSWDRDHIFARVTGSFAACSLTILKADIFTRADDIAIETFFVATEKLEAVVDPRDRDAFEKILFQAMSMEQFDFNKAFARRNKPRIPAYDLSQMATQVSVDQDASSDYTLLDVQTADYPGLLYRIACALVENGVNIASARISTEKGAALDTFYLCDPAGKKITSERVLQELTKEMRARITA
jgi:[protein-PII] uridylyltransferase